MSIQVNIILFQDEAEGLEVEDRSKPDSLISVQRESFMRCSSMSATLSMVKNREGVGLQMLGST